MSFHESELDIQEIFNEVTKYAPREPKSFPLQFELPSLKELFEFLLQFVTMICKDFYGDANGQVNLANMSLEEFTIVDKYMQSIGYTCDFKGVPANAHNINNTYNNRYDRVSITDNTKLSDLLFGIKCGDILYIISFDNI
jgi:hypothetical protein